MKTDQTTTPGTFSVRVDFADSQDMLNFTNYAIRAKEQDGTVTGVYAGVMCSALKRAKVQPMPEASDDTARLLIQSLADMRMIRPGSEAAKYRRLVNQAAQDFINRNNGVKS